MTFPKCYTFETSRTCFFWLDSYWLMVCSLSLSEIFWWNQLHVEYNWKVTVLNNRLHEFCLTHSVMKFWHYRGFSRTDHSRNCVCNNDSRGSLPYHPLIKQKKWNEYLLKNLFKIVFLRPLIGWSPWSSLLLNSASYMRRWGFFNDAYILKLLDQKGLLEGDDKSRTLELFESNFWVKLHILFFLLGVL